MASLSFAVFYQSGTVAAGELEEVYAAVIGKSDIMPTYKNPFLKPPARTFLDAVKSVKSGTAAAEDITLISTLATEKRPEAVELLAWMNATGTGIPQNFYNAWFLYTEANDLGVTGAKENAAVIHNLITFQGSKKACRNCPK